MTALRRGPDHLGGRLRFAPDCPFFEGHFPGHPVLPAVAQLKLVLQICRRELGLGRSPRGIPRTKFAAPIEPGSEVCFLITARRGRPEVKWRFTRGQAVVASGVFLLER